MESLRDLTEQTCQRFAVCQKKRHPVVLAPAAAGEKGSTQPCCWSRGSVQSAQHRTAKQKEQRPPWLCSSRRRFELKGVQ